MKKHIWLSIFTILSVGVMLACHGSNASENKNPEPKEVSRESEKKPSADEKKQGPPVAVVALGEITSGKAEPCRTGT